jgi:hypothetical protein
MEDIIEFYDKFINSNADHKYYTNLEHQKIIKIWKNKSFKKYFEKIKLKIDLSEEVTQLIDKLTSGFNHNNSIFDYSPDLLDCLLFRTRTTGINNVKYKFNNISINLFDVGGQRSERKVILLKVILIEMV